MRRIGYLFSLLAVLLCGCGLNRDYSKEPEDKYSEYVCENMNVDFSYLGREQAYDGSMVYTYFADYEQLSKDNITSFMNTVRTLSVNKELKICFQIGAQTTGWYGGSCALQNYIKVSDDVDEYIQFSEMCVYIITYNYDSVPIITEPETFTGVTGIKYLMISKEMQEKAEEKGIDWYEIWSDLQEVVVFG